MKSRRVLLVATVAATIGSFNMENIYILQKLGYEVDIAADFTDTSVWSIERLQRFKDQLDELGIEQIQLNFSRRLFKFGNHVSSYKKAIGLLREKNYSFIHTHTPIASAIMRIAAHKTRTKIIYTAHGFHFYDGAPAKNWILFYPIEKWLSKWTDILITINQEDYKRAFKRFHAKKTVYIPGVGLNTQKFREHHDGDRIKKELGIDNDMFVLLSVGELNANKNHEIVVRAITGLNLVYIIVGKGELEKHLRTVANEVGADVILTGYRTDVAEFYAAADCYILPSIREGLNVSLMEAMASGLPCLAGSIRGNVDLIDKKGGYLFDPKNLNEVRDTIIKMMNNNEEMGKHNIEKIRFFSIQSINRLVTEIYMEI